MHCVLSFEFIKKNYACIFTMCTLFTRNGVKNDLIDQIKHIPTESHPVSNGLQVPS